MPLLADAWVTAQSRQRGMASEPTNVGGETDVRRHAAPQSHGRAPPHVIHRTHHSTKRGTFPSGRFELQDNSIDLARNRNPSRRNRITKTSSQARGPKMTTHTTTGVPYPGTPNLLRKVLIATAAIGAAVAIAIAIALVLDSSSSSDRTNVVGLSSAISRGVGTPLPQYAANTLSVGPAASDRAMERAMERLAQTKVPQVKATPGSQAGFGWSASKMADVPTQPNLNLKSAGTNEAGYGWSVSAFPDGVRVTAD